MCFFFFWNFSMLSILVWCLITSKAKSQGTCDYVLWEGMTVWGPRGASISSFLSLVGEIKDSLDARKSCIFFIFLLTVKGIYFFLDLEEDKYIILMSSINEKFLPSLKKNLKAWPWLARVWLKSWHWVAKWEVFSLTSDIFGYSEIYINWFFWLDSRHNIMMLKCWICELYI